jgi:hypothetical protein
MILASHGLIASSILQVDADWLAYYNRVIAAGGSLTTTEQDATKTLVADLKTAGIWSAMKAIYPMVGASAAACAQNLKSSSFTGTFTSGWTFASTGVTPNGTSAYMNTNLVPSTTLTNNFSHISLYSRTNNILAQLEMGAWPVTSVFTNRFLMALRYTDGNFQVEQYKESTSRVQVANSDSKGFYISSRTNSTTHKAYKNNSQFGSTNTGDAGNISNITLSIYIGAVNTTVFPGYSTKEIAFSSIGDGLTDTQASNFYTAVQAFQTTLARQV